MAIEFDNLHTILCSLYQEMMPLCSNMAGVAKGIAGLGALFYVDTIVWAFLILLSVIWMRYGFAALAPCMFFFGTLGICMLSPKSGEIRYLMPILYALPVMVGAVMLPTKGKGEMKNA